MQCELRWRGAEHGVSGEFRFRGSEGTVAHCDLRHGRGGYARVANTGPVFGGQFLSNGGTVRWQITGTDFYLVQFGPGSDHYAAALINVESFFANTSGSGRLIFPPANVRFPRTIYFPIKVYHIEGNASDTILRPKPGAVFDDDVMFRVNVDANGNWISAYPGPRSGTIGSFQLANDANIDIRGFEFGGSYKMRGGSGCKGRRRI